MGGGTGDKKYFLGNNLDANVRSKKTYGDLGV